MDTVRNRALLYVVITGFAILGAVSGLEAQGEKEESTPRGQGEMGGQMMEHCKAMMAVHEEAMSEMRSMEAKLDELVARMNAAEGTAKVDALAEAVTELALQRKEMMVRTMTMQPRMTQHMMKHMRMGMMENTEQPTECPMMKEMMKGDQSEEEVGEGR
jgi:hypothetical protein